ncbi:MAG: RDD family protein [Ginsengibacter sp.]
MTATSLQSILKTKANLKKRIIATIIDYALFLLPVYLYINYFGQVDNEGVKTVSGLMALPIPISWLIYFVVIEACYGATIAYQGMYLKVLTIDRKEIEWTQAFKRHLLDPIDILMWGIPAIIAIKNSDKHQRLGDMWAKTIVVDTKDKEQVF